MAKILLIGGTGTLSTAVMKRAVAQGYDVYVLNRGLRNKKLLPSVVFLKADFYDVISIERAIDGLSFDIVVDFLSRKANDISRVFTLFQGVKQYMFISSACVYRRAKEDGVITEKSPKPNLDWSYNIEKYECEKRLIELASTSRTCYTIIRPYITYDENRIPFGLAPRSYKTHWTIVARILAKKPMFVWDDGNALCTLTHVDDFAVGVVGLFKNPKAYNEDFHITTNISYTWNEMLECLFEVCGTKTLNVIKIPSTFIAAMMPSDKDMLLGDRMLDAKFDITKIKDAVPEYQPAIDLKSGLKRIIANYQANNYLDGIDYYWDGLVDKMIISYTKQNKISIAKIRFVDYLQHNRFNDRKTYLIGRYKIVAVIKKILKKIQVLCH